MEWFVFLFRSRCFAWEGDMHRKSSQQRKRQCQLRLPFPQSSGAPALTPRPTSKERSFGCSAASPSRSIASSHSFSCFHLFAAVFYVGNKNFFERHVFD